jgi:hypothetical protein
METKTINLRAVPEELVRRAKAHAALRGISLKDFILDAMHQVLDSSGASLALFVHPGGKKEKNRKGKK